MSQNENYLLILGQIWTPSVVPTTIYTNVHSDDTTTESVQYYTVRSKFTVSTLTCLDHLAVREDCECDVKQCVIKVGCEYSILCKYLILNYFYIKYFSQDILFFCWIHQTHLAAGLIKLKISLLISYRRVSLEPFIHCVYCVTY